MLNLMKRLASRLPDRAQEELQRWTYGMRIRSGRFVHYEPEFAKLGDWVKEGDTVLDIGANVGVYTLRLSNLVGSTGRIFAFEPVARTFAIAAANTRLLRHENITWINAAASDAIGFVQLETPHFESGLVAYPQASINASPSGNTKSFSAYAFPIDALAIPPRVSFVKIDVEGHELSVLKGMSGLLTRDQPTVVLEGDDPDVNQFLKNSGYTSDRLTESPNTIYTPHN